MMDLPRRFEVKTAVGRPSYYIVDLDAEMLFWSETNGRPSASGVTVWQNYPVKKVSSCVKSGAWEITQVFEPAICPEVTDLL